MKSVGVKMITSSLLLLLHLSQQLAAATSTPFVTQVAGPSQREEQRTAEAKPVEGFMEDIGFSNFFQDVGVEAAGSSPALTQVLPAASSQFPAFNFAFGAPGEKTKEQLAQMKEQGFMPADPFGSSSHHAASNIAPPEAFKDSHDSPFGSSSNTFEIPKSFHSEFGSFDFGDFKSSVAPKKADKESEKKQRNNAAGSEQVEHRPRGQSASKNRPRYAQRRHDNFADSFPDTGLYASSSKKQEKKNKGNCEVVHKDGMTCEVCNDGEGGFSEHCSHSQNSGKDSKFTNTRKHTSDDVLKPQKGQKQEAKVPAPAYQPAQQRRVQQRQQPQQQHGDHQQQRQHPADPHRAYDFGGLGFGGSPFAQSRKDSVYDKQADPFDGFNSDPFDHFAEGSNVDPYKFEFPKFDAKFDFGPDDHKKLVKQTGLHDENKQTSKYKETRVPAKDPRKQSGSQQNKVAEKNLGYKPAKTDKNNYEQLGKMVDQFGKKNRRNCKKEIRKSMTCYVCPNEHGQTDEECMFASNDPNSQHMMYTEESSYGNPE